MQKPRDHDLMLTAARLVGIGHTYVAAGRAVSRDESTIRRWSKLSAFQAERERAREESVDPSPRRVLIDALTATKDNGSPDWNARLRAAGHLLELEAQPPSPDEQDSVVAALSPVARARLGIE